MKKPSIVCGNWRTSCQVKPSQFTEVSSHVLSHRVFFLKFYFYILYVSVRECMPRVHKYLQRPEEGITHFGNEVTGSCELLDTGVGNPTQSSA